MIPRAIAHDEYALVVLDWSWLCHQAWHIGGVDKVASIVLGRLARIMSDPMPPSMAIAVDPERVDPDDGSVRRRWTFRDKATAHLPENERYKAGRIPKPPALAAIERRMLRIVREYRIPILAPADPTAEQDWEADDSAASAVRLAVAEGRSVALVSGDKDWLALVQNSDPSRPVVVRWDGRDEVLGDDEVLAKLQVWPRQVTDYLAIVGDASDNVPGVKGIGAKGAARVLLDHGTLDAALAAAPLTRAERLLHEQKDAALFSRSLVRLWDEAPIEWDPSEQLMGGFNMAAVRKLYYDFGFVELMRNVPEFPKRAWYPDAY